MEEIDLREVFNIIKKRALIIVLCIIIMVTTIGITSCFSSIPQYRTSTSIIISNIQDNGQSISCTGIVTDEKLIKTFTEIAKSRTISNIVIRNLKIDITPKRLSNKVNIAVIEDTGVIKIEVIDENPKVATNIANEISNVFIQYVNSESKIVRIKVLDKAEIPLSPINSKLRLNIAIAVMLGILIGLLLIFIIEYFDNTLRTTSDVEKHLGMPVIGIVPKLSKEKNIISSIKEKLRGMKLWKRKS